MTDVTADTLLDGRVTLWQPRRGHRAGTDAALLAAAVPAKAHGVFYDLGSGVGSVGLCLAALEPDRSVVLVEADADIAALAERSIAASLLAGRVRVAVADIIARGALRRAGLEPESGDVVVTNPPFHVEGSIRSSPSAYRRAAHALPADGDASWIRAALSLLRPGGQLVMIHRADALARLLPAFTGRAGDIRLKPVYPRRQGPATRILLKAVKASRAPLILLPPLVLHDDDGAFTPEAEALQRGAASIDWGG